MSTPAQPLSIAQQMLQDGSLPDMPETPTPMRAVVAAAATLNPDAEAKTQQLAQRAGMPVDLTRHDPQSAQQLATANDLDQRELEITNPILAQQLRDPNFAAVAHDDLDSLSRIEQGGAELRAWNPTLWERAKMKLADAFTATTDTTPTQAVRNIYNSPARLAPDVVGGAAGFAGNIGSFYLGWHGSGPTRENLLQRVDTLLSPESVFKNDPYADAAPYMKSNTGDMLAKNAGPLIASMFVSGGTSEIAAALKLSPTAGKVLTALMVGSMFSADQGGQTFTQMSAAGKSDAEARRDALLTSALTLVPNTAMGLTDFAPWLKRNPLLASLGVGAATGATGQLAQNVVTGQPWQTGLGNSAIQGAAVMGGMHIGMGGFEPAEGEPGVAEGPKTFQQTLAGMVDDAERSKLRTRSPEAFQHAMNANFEGDDSLRVPTQDFVNYFAGKKLDPAAAANGLGVTNLEEAATAGSDLEIPKANFFGKLDPEHQKGLLPDVIDPSTELTARQMEAGRQELEQWVSSGGIEKLQAEYAAADAETQATPEWQAVKSELKQRYAAAGETETAAEDLSTVHANAIANLARNAGLKPDELLALHNPNIVAAEAAPGALYQSGAPINGVEGKTSTLLTPGGRSPAQYKLVEAADLVPSHNPTTFERNEAYPAGVQERAYDTSKEAQARVIGQAQNYEPAYTVNTNPDAVNGPPVITPDGTVLGGNSRAMSTIRLYRDGDPAAYREALKRGAPEFGFKPEDVDAMKEPVLVRQVEAPEDTESLRRMGSDLNKSMTGALGVSERAVSAGKSIKPETLRWAADAMNTEDLSLRELLAKHGGELARRLVQDGVITDRERPQFVDSSTGGLSEEGKTFAERALLGTVLDDPRLMDAAPKSVLQKLERSLGSITSFASRPDEWNLLPAIRAAVGELGSIQREGVSVETRLGQTSLFGEVRDPVVDALVRALDGKPTAVREAFESYARDADENKPGQSRMFGSGDAFDAFNHAFGGKLTVKEFHDGLESAAQSENAAGDADLSRVAAGSEGAGGEEPGRETGPGAAGSGPERDASERARSTGEPEPADGHATAVGGKRGWFRILADGRYEIGKTEIGDLSTFIHEPAHGYLEMFRELTGREGASPQLQSDFKKICEWLGTSVEEARRDGFTTEQHEQWARANEEYVREGKAPSAGLRRVFHHFAVWLGSIYRRAGDLGVGLSADVRGVMDRLYASENAVDRAEREAPEKLFENPEEAGWTEAEYKNYADAHGIAADKAKAEVQRELNEAAVRERTQAWREEKGNVRDAVTEEIDARPEYKAIRSLRRGKTDLGTDLTLNRDELVKQFGEERVKALQDLHRGLYRQEGGTDAETASELLGFGSGEEMMRAMENVPRRARAIEAATRDYMTAKHGDIRYDGSLDDKERLALENDERAKSLHKEVGALRARVAVLEKRAADTKATKRALAPSEFPRLDAYKTAAKVFIDQKSFADLNPTRYLYASRRYAREAFDAVRRGATQQAYDAKSKELLNHYMFREASAARDYADKFERERVAMQKANFQQKLALAGSDYREQFNWLGARNRMWAPTGAPERSLSAWADDMHDRGNELELAPSVLSENKFQDYRSIPLAEVRELHDALVNIRHLAMREFKMFVQGKQVEFAGARTAMIERAHETGTWKPETVLKEEPTRLSNLAGYLRSVDTANTRMEYEIVDLDGGTQGPWHDNLWNLYENAKGDEYGLQHEVTKSLADLVGERSTKEGLRLLDKVTVDGIPTTEPVTRKTLVSMALNIGNDGNRDRLEKTFDHHSWDRKVIDQLAGNKGSPGLLTADEWRFTQRAWDTFKPLGVRMVEMMRRLVGLPPKMVTVTPFDVYLADGTVMHMEGGYYPIVADEEKSLSRGYQQDASKTAGNLMEKGYLRASTATGYTKERQGYGGPILLDYERVLTSSLAKEVKDISHREVMLVANKFLTDPDIRRTLRERRGPGADERFSSWLRATVNDRNGSLDFGANDPRSAIESLRINLVKAGLCFKASTAIQQITHLSRIMLFTKPGPFMQSMVDFWKDPAAMTQAIRELSPNEMRFRGENLSRDYRAALNDVAGKTGTLARASRLGMAAFKYEDHVVSFPLWHSVYNESMRRNAEMPEEQARPLAVHDADAAVRMGMGTGATGDLPPIMRSNDELLKLETTLFGFHNLNYQILRHKVLGAATRDFRAGNYVRGAANLTGGAALAWIIPALVGSLVTGNGPKDGENAGLWAAKRSLFFAGGTIPFLKDIVSAFEYGSVNPVVNYAKAITGAAEGIASKKEDKDWTELGINALEIGGEGLGLPGTEQAAHTARYVHRASQGKIANPSIYGALVAGR